MLKKKLLLSISAKNHHQLTLVKNTLVDIGQNITSIDVDQKTIADTNKKIVPVDVGTKNLVNIDQKTPKIFFHNYPTHTLLNMEN